jgi:hypothetical protein
LTPQAASDWTFQDWGGRNSTDLIDNLDGTWGLVMEEDKSVTANFSQETYTLTVSKSGTGSGTVTSNPAGINCGLDCSEEYNDNTLVTLYVQPASGSTFSGWSGACSGMGACLVTMVEARSVTAGSP